MYMSELNRFISWLEDVQSLDKFKSRNPTDTVSLVVTVSDVHDLYEFLIALRKHRIEQYGGQDALQ